MSAKKEQESCKRSNQKTLVWVDFHCAEDLRLLKCRRYYWLILIKIYKQNIAYTDRSPAMIYYQNLTAPWLPEQLKKKSVYIIETKALIDITWRAGRH